LRFLSKTPKVEPHDRRLRLHREPARPKRESEERCEPPKDVTYKEGLNHLHRIMVEGVKEMFLKDGTCSTHGATFLVCERTSIVGRPRHILYKIDEGQMIEWSTHLYDAAEITEPRGPKEGAR